MRSGNRQKNLQLSRLVCWFIVCRFPCVDAVGINPTSLSYDVYSQTAPLRCTVYRFCVKGIVLGKDTTLARTTFGRPLKGGFGLAAGRELSS